jgi:hypothetical protein
MAARVTNISPTTDATTFDRYLQTLNLPLCVAGQTSLAMEASDPQHHQFKMATVTFRDKGVRNQALKLPQTALHVSQSKQPIHFDKHFSSFTAVSDGNGIECARLLFYLMCH